MNLQACWSPICNVDEAPLRWWLELLDAAAWPAMSGPTKPQRLRELPGPVLAPIVDAVLAHFPGGIAHAPMLSRMLSGQEHPLHVDIQRADWITRVHVPVATNPGAWLLFEEEGRRVHFEAGRAYTFDTLRRHAFGNDGTEDRVHLVFEVLRKDG